MPLLLAIYDKPSFAVLSLTRSQSVDALARIAAPDTVPVLRRAMDDESIRNSSRCEVARALVQHDIEEGRTFLLERYREYLDRLPNRFNTAWEVDPTDSLQQMSDAKVLAALIQMRETETEEMPQRNLDTHIQIMRLNGLAVSDLVKIALDDEWDPNRKLRYEAIRALGRTAGVEVIPQLETLRPWRTTGPGAVHHHSIANLDEFVAGQQRQLRQFVRQAIAEIKARHWSATQEPK